jgi:hypothetical protein
MVILGLNRHRMAPLTTLIFFASFVVLSGFFIATYGGRSAWVACCSTAMSIAALIGIVFVSSFENVKQVRAGLTLLARQLPLVLDQRTLDELKIAIDQTSKSSKCIRERPSCMVASRVPSPAPQDADARSSEARPAKQDASNTSLVETQKASEEISRWPVAWLPDDSALEVSENPAPGLWVGGINISDEPLREVQGILKLDANQRELKLTVRIKGNKFEDKAVIRAGARFAMGVEIPKTNKQTGGAILTFRYTYAGQQRAQIFYLTAAMITRLASAG